MFGVIVSVHGGVASLLCAFCKAEHGLGEERVAEESYSVHGQMQERESKRPVSHYPPSVPSLAFKAPLPHRKIVIKP